MSLAKREGEESYIEGNREKEKRDRRERREWDRESEEETGAFRYSGTREGGEG